MNMTYNEEVDALTITLGHAPIVDSDEVKPGVILDYDAAGNTVSIEILDASRRIDNLYSVSYNFAKAKLEQPELVPQASRP